MSKPLMRVSNPTAVPHGGLYRYKDNETGVVITHPYFVQVRAKAHAHRVANQLPIPTSWEAVFEDNVCLNTPECPCEPSDEGLRRTWQLAQKFTASMARWAKEGFPMASEQVRESRRDVCEGRNGHERCPKWQDHGTSLFGYGRCASCGCNTGLKTAIATEKCPLNKWPA